MPPHCPSLSSIPCPWVLFIALGSPFLCCYAPLFLSPHLPPLSGKIPVALSLLPAFTPSCLSCMGLQVQRRFFFASFPPSADFLFPLFVPRCAAFSSGAFFLFSQISDTQFLCPIFFSHFVRTARRSPKTIPASCASCTFVGQKCPSPCPCNVTLKLPRSISPAPLLLPFFSPPFCFLSILLAFGTVRVSRYLLPMSRAPFGLISFTSVALSLRFSFQFLPFGTPLCFNLYHLPKSPWGRNFQTPGPPSFGAIRPTRDWNFYDPPGCPCP